MTALVWESARVAVDSAHPASGSAFSALDGSKYWAAWAALAEAFIDGLVEVVGGDPLELDPTDEELDGVRSLGPSQIGDRTSEAIREARPRHSRARPPPTHRSATPQCPHCQTVRPTTRLGSTHHFLVPPGRSLYARHPDSAALRAADAAEVLLRLTAGRPANSSPAAKSVALRGSGDSGAAHREPPRSAEREVETVALATFVPPRPVNRLGPHLHCQHQHVLDEHTAGRIVRRTLAIQMEVRHEPDDRGFNRSIAFEFL